MKVLKRPRAESAVARTARRQRRWVLLSVALVLVAGLLAATARWFAWPTQGMPARVDAIVMLNGPGDRLTTAEDLARAHRAPMLVVSRGSRYWGRAAAARHAYRGSR